MRYSDRTGKREIVITIEESVTKFSIKLVYKYRYDFVPTPECQVWPSFVTPGMAGGGKKEREPERLSLEVLPKHASVAEHLQQ